MPRILTHQSMVIWRERKRTHLHENQVARETNSNIYHPRWDSSLQMLAYITILGKCFHKCLDN